MEQILTKFLTNIKLVRKENNTYYVRMSAVNNGQSIIRLNPYNDTIYVSKKVELMCGPQEVTIRKSELDKLELGKWHNSVSFWAFVAAIFHKQGGITK